MQVIVIAAVLMTLVVIMVVIVVMIVSMVMRVIVSSALKVARVRGWQSFHMRDGGRSLAVQRSSLRTGRDQSLGCSGLTRDMPRIRSSAPITPLNDITCIFPL